MSAVLAAELLAATVDAAPRKMLLFPADRGNLVSGPLFNTNMPNMGRPATLIIKKQQQPHNLIEPDETE